MKKLFSCITLFLPFLTWGSEWRQPDHKKGEVYPIPDVRDAYQLKSGGVECYVAVRQRDGSVMFHFWERKKDDAIRKENGKSVPYTLDHSIFLEGKMDNDKGTLEGYELGHVVHGAKGSSLLNPYDGEPNFAHPCERYVSAIPHKKIREVLTRYAKTSKEKKKPSSP